ncbi:hypothetical protein HN935_02840 [archaeon]|jgi:hypothetical protein|nr:hypothetical protein [Candidatus Jacksonbacteria bacterium]MBT7102425.1 hypothetical protein [archaeon]
MAKVDTISDIMKRIGPSEEGHLRIFLIRNKGFPEVDDAIITEALRSFKATFRVWGSLNIETFRKILTEVKKRGPSN